MEQTLLGSGAGAGFGGLAEIISEHKMEGQSGNLGQKHIYQTARCSVEIGSLRHNSVT